MVLWMFNDGHRVYVYTSVWTYVRGPGGRDVRVLCTCIHGESWTRTLCINEGRRNIYPGPKPTGTGRPGDRGYIAGRIIIIPVLLLLLLLLRSRTRILITLVFHSEIVFEYSQSAGDKRYDIYVLPSTLCVCVCVWCCHTALTKCNVCKKKKKQQL